MTDEPDFNDPEMLVISIALPAPAEKVARLLRAVERAFPGATLHAIDGGWAIEIGGTETWRRS